MATTTVVTVVPPLFDEAKLAVTGFLARYSGPTRVSYACDLRQWSPGATRTIFLPSPSAAATSNCGPGTWKHTDGPRPPWRGACRRWPASTDSR
jgi:hypothetical protein